MKLHRMMPSVALLFCAPLFAQETPVYVGVVTDPGTPTRFQVDGTEVVCTPGKTMSAESSAKDKYTGELTCPQHALGDLISVTGRRREHTIFAELVRVQPPADTSVSGAALIDRVLSADGQTVTVRADGYTLLIGQRTQMKYEAGLNPGLQAFQTNQWIEYRGTLHPDGQVAVEQATLAPNVISDREHKLRSKEEFDPAQVSDAKRQTSVGRFFTGPDRKRLPAYIDPAMQARVDTIGTRLVPAYQRNLPEGDPSKIDFRFQLVKEDKYAYFTLANGIVLLSHGAVEAAADDAQLAVLLSLAVAEVLQKQELRARPTQGRMLAASIAGGAVGLVIPGASLVPLLTNHAAEERLKRRIMQQNSREALCLLHDAGYDLREAPTMVWKLESKPGESLQDTHISEQVKYLYQLLGTVWRSELQHTASQEQETALVH